jgi:hypothetical protein
MLLSKNRVDAPLQLDWEHAKDVTMDLSEYACVRGSRVRESCARGGIETIRSGLRRLSVYQRRKRIGTVQDISLEQVQAMEVDLGMDQIQQAIQVTLKLASEGPISSAATIKSDISDDRVRRKPRWQRKESILSSCF